MSLDKTSEVIVNLVKEAEDIFTPTDVQRQVKAKLLAAIHDNPLYSLDDLTEGGAVELTRDRRLRAWWEVEGFQDWLKNKNEFRQRVEHITAKLLDAMERIASSTNPKLATAQVNAMKAFMEVGNKMPSKQKEITYKDAAIAAMDPLKLEEFLRKSGWVRIETKNPLAIDASFVDNDSNTEVVNEGKAENTSEGSDN